MQATSHVYNSLQCVLTLTSLYLQIYTRDLKYTVNVYDVNYNYVHNVHSSLVVMHIVAYKVGMYVTHSFAAFSGSWDPGVHACVCEVMLSELMAYLGHIFIHVTVFDVTVFFHWWVWLGCSIQSNVVIMVILYSGCG